MKNSFNDVYVQMFCRGCLFLSCLLWLKCLGGGVHTCLRRCRPADHQTTCPVFIHLPLSFWAVSHMGGGVQFVPLNTSHPVHPLSAAPPRAHTNYSTLTQHVCERQRGREGGRAGWCEPANWLSVSVAAGEGGMVAVLVGQVCTALLERRKEGRQEGRWEGRKKEQQRGWDKTNHVGGVNPVKGEAAVRGGEVSVRLKILCVCSRNVAVSVSGLLPPARGRSG